MENSRLKNVVYFLPLLAALLIFCGYIKLNYYYSHFNVEIRDYLELDEILGLVLDDLWVAGVLIGLYIVIQVVLGGALEKIKIPISEEDIKNESVLLKDAEVNKFTLADLAGNLLESKLVATIIWGILFVLLMAFYVAYYAFNYHSDWLFWFIIVLSIQFWVITIYFSIGNFLGEKIHISESFQNNSLVLVLVLTFVVNRGHHQANSTLDGKNPYEVEMVVGGRLIKTSNDLLYVGKTKQFYFFYDKSKSKSFVYHEDEVESRKFIAK